MTRMRSRDHERQLGAVLPGGMDEISPRVAPVGLLGRIGAAGFEPADFMVPNQPRLAKLRPPPRFIQKRATAGVPRN